MKKIITIATALLAVLPLVAFAQNDGYYSGSYTRMSYVKGDVYVQRGQDQGYEQGEVNLVIVEGDKLGTKNGRLEIQLGRRNHLRLNDFTQVDIAALPKSDSDPTKIHLLSGSIFVRIGSLDREKSFEIHTPDASFYVMEAGLYRVDIGADKNTEFRVFSGSAEAAGEEGSVLVKEGERIVAADGRFSSESSSLISRRDDFGDWNESRDAVYSRTMSRTYLPAEYADYENELADNGNWVNEESYGNVWVPRHAYSDWQPYHDGRWAWYPIIGWTWVSYEPWGWCTSHYGRWGWGMNLGWYWIPYSHWSWGPAWVHWYWDNDYIGWCPLSYYNYPGVILNNRFYDRYSRGYFPNNSRSLVMIHRNQLQNRRISQVALDRSRISRIDRISLKAAQPNMRPSAIRDGALATKARAVLSRDNLRSVNKSFAAVGKGVSRGELKPSVVRKSAEPSSIRPEQKAVGRDAAGVGRNLRSPSSIRSFPSRNTFANPADRSAGNSISRNREPGASNPSSAKIAPPSLRNGNDGRTIVRKYESTEPTNRVPLTVRPSRDVSTKDAEPRTSRGTTPQRIIKDRGVAGNNAAPFPGSAPSRDAGLSSRNSSVSQRRMEAPSRSYSAPTRSVSPSSRSYSASSRSVSPSSRSYSAPSRSVSPSSRSYSAPSRSSSSPSRSYSAPSRSSSGSNSGSSRGSSSSSSSRSGGGRKK